MKPKQPAGPPMTLGNMRVALRPSAYEGRLNATATT
jgi:hypothetical protein